MKKREMLHSKLNKIEKWCLNCFTIFCNAKVNDIRGPAVLASQLRRFIISFLQIMLFYMNICFQERKTKKRETKQTWLLKKLIWQICSTNFWKGISKHMSGQQAQIECSRLWHEIKKGKEDAATKSEAQKPMLQWKKM